MSHSHFADLPKGRITGSVTVDGEEFCYGWVKIFVPNRYVHGDEIYLPMYFDEDQLKQGPTSFDFEVPIFTTTTRYQIHIMNNITNVYDFINIKENETKHFEWSWNNGDHLRHSS